MTADSLGTAASTLAHVAGYNVSPVEISAFCAITGLVCGAVVHFTHLAINKWRAAGGSQGIKNFFKTGKTTNQ